MISVAHYDFEITMRVNTMGWNQKQQHPSILESCHFVLPGVEGFAIHDSCSGSGIIFDNVIENTQVGIMVVRR